MTMANNFPSDPLGPLIELWTTEARAPLSDGYVETFTAAAACLTCGSDVRYPYLIREEAISGLCSEAICVGGCGKVVLVPMRDGFVHYWGKAAPRKQEHHE